MDEKNIIEITSEGLTYMDENGENQFIDFAVCWQHYLNTWNDPIKLQQFKEVNPSSTDEKLEENIKWMRTLKEIGGRDFAIPYIQFYTEPPTRFIFTSRLE